VAVTERFPVMPANRALHRLRRVAVRGVLPAMLFVTAAVHAAVLPEDRADLMYHSYDGGGVTASGPALLVRKNVSDNVSLSGRYYVDTVSSASIDVVTTASPYSEKREEMGVGVDVLHGNSLMSAFVTSSKESDYQSDTFNLNVAHELFGGRTTVSLGYGQGKDVVGRVDNGFQANLSRYNFRLGVTQVLTPSLLLGISFEDVAEDGYLANPYRSARLLGASIPEIYPGTRDSQAVAVRLVKGFDGGDRAVRSSLRAEYRYFQDSWTVGSSTLGLAYQRYFGDRWLGELRYRYYQQSAASFYSDNFTAPMSYMSRDKELSTFHDHSIGTRWSWTFLKGRYLFIDRASLNLAYDYIRFSYDDFTDVRTGQPYSFGANVIQLYISAWY
jgi:hypothetical protein